MNVFMFYTGMYRDIVCFWVRSQVMLFHLGCSQTCREYLGHKCWCSDYSVFCKKGERRVEQSVAHMKHRSLNKPETGISKFEKYEDLSKNACIRMLNVNCVRKMYELLTFTI